jgi:phage tail sheath protein FI
MAEQFLHGVEIVQVDTKLRPVETVKSSVIGLIGTAPNADPLMLGNWYRSADFGATGTLKDTLDAIYDHIGPWVVVVRVAEGQTLDETLVNIVGSYQARTGVHAFYKAGPDLQVIPRLLIAPGLTSQRMTGGVTQVDVTAGGTGYTSATVAIAGAGVGAKAQAVITAGAITSIVVTITGDGTGATAEATIGTSANPVVAELLGIAARRAHRRRHAGPRAMKTRTTSMPWPSKILPKCTLAPRLRGWALDYPRRRKR